MFVRNFLPEPFKSTSPTFMPIASARAATWTSGDIRGRWTNFWSDRPCCRCHHCHQSVPEPFPEVRNGEPPGQHTVNQKRDRWLCYLLDEQCRSSNLCRAAPPDPPCISQWVLWTEERSFIILVSANGQFTACSCLKRFGEVVPIAFPCYSNISNH